MQVPSYRDCQKIQPWRSTGCRSAALDGMCAHRPSDSASRFESEARYAASLRTTTCAMRGRGRITRAITPISSCAQNEINAPKPIAFSSMVRRIYSAIPLQVALNWGSLNFARNEIIASALHFGY
jgi:hypothetical protein